MSEWKIVKFSQLAKGHRGVSYKPHQLLSHYTENVTILLRSNNIKNSKLNFDELQFVLSDIVSDTQRCRQNDIVMCMSNGSRHLVGKNAFVSQTNGQNYTCGAFCSLFRTEDGQIPGFIFSLLQSQFFQKQLDITLSGSAINNLQNSQVENFDFFIPSSLELQRKIAKILTTCDTVIEQTQSTIAKYKAIKQGMLHDLFTCGLDANGKLRPTYQQAPELYKESELGMIPKEWEVKRLEEMSTMKSGDGITAQFISDTGDYPVYGGNGLRGFTKTYTHQGDYVLIGRQGALCGNITRVSNKFFASEHAVVVTTNKDIDVEWLAQKLDYMNLNRYSEASAQPGLAVAKILRLFITKPQYNEQIEIGKRLLALDYNLKSEGTLLSKYQSIKRGLMGDLLGGKKEV